MITEINYVCNAMQQHKRNDDSTAHFVQVNMMVERKKMGKTVHSQPSYTVTQHQNNYESAIKVQTLT